MRSFWYIIHLVHAVLAGDLYGPTAYSPAIGIAYSAPPVVAPQPVSPLHYASPLRTSVGYGPLAAARFNQVAATAPLVAPAPAAVAYAPAAVAYAPAAPAYTPAAPLVTKYAAVPAVADIPITRYVAQPGFIQKYVDVAHSKIATSKIQIRRPAIQKQFYDIEERVVVRPVASAVVELDQPLSKSQTGPTVVHPALPGQIHAVPAAYPVVPGPVAAAPFPPVPTYGPPPPSTPQNPEFPEISSPSNGQESDDSDSITVENEDVRARSGTQASPQEDQAEPQPQSRFRPQPQPESRFQPQPQPETRFQPQPQPETRFQPQPQPETRFQPQPQPETQFQPQPQPETRFQPEPQPETRFQPEPQPQPEERNQQDEQLQSRSGSIPLPPSQTQARFLSRQQISPLNNFAPESRSYSEEVIPSSRASLSEEQSQSNQQRLIELLTGRGGVTEVRSGVSVKSSGEGQQIRGRVLSVTPAPQSSGSPDERVSTRRVVVNRPIQTLQEIDVVQPFTKLQRVSVQQPAFFKTQRVDIARVKTIAPVPVNSYTSYPYPYVH
ncbi:uncharacterized protein LOC142328069 [Lycorma delicatula]|uniref:uncharacterized protein LOC142328069 n=1 Tax=Lycorma delicatula TaxID=130591 RepID=UPI003F50FEE0